MPATKERLTISVDASIKHDLEKQVSKSQRSAFAEKALEEALDKLARQKALEVLDALPSKTTSQKVKSQDILRELRQEQGDHLLENSSQK